MSVWGSKCVCVDVCVVYVCVSQLVCEVVVHVCVRVRVTVCQPTSTFVGLEVGSRGREPRHGCRDRGRECGGSVRSRSSRSVHRGSEETLMGPMSVVVGGPAVQDSSERRKGRREEEDPG